MIGSAVSEISRFVLWDENDDARRRKSPGKYVEVSKFQGSPVELDEIKSISEIGRITIYLGVGSRISSRIRQDTLFAGTLILTSSHLIQSTGDSPAHSIGHEPNNVLLEVRIDILLGQSEHKLYVCRVICLSVCLNKVEINYMFVCLSVCLFV